MSETLIIRADARVAIGTGHLMRCLALGQAWQDEGGKVVFITACDSQGLLRRLCDEGFAVHELADTYPAGGDWEITSGILHAHPGAWMVLDGYHFDEIYHQRVMEAGHRLLVIDDMAHLPHYHADILLNQNLHADQLSYACEPSTRLLLGTRYVLLRREFFSLRARQRKIPSIARKLLITLGGSDPYNATLKVIHALLKIDTPGLEAAVVIGPANGHKEELMQVANAGPVIVNFIDNACMSELMAWADVAITAGGSTSWELAFMGLPSLILVLADNQRYSAEHLHKMGIASNLGLFQDVSQQEIKQALRWLLEAKMVRTKMSRLGMEIVNGLGKQKLISAMRRIGR